MTMTEITILWATTSTNCDNQLTYTTFTSDKDPTFHPHLTDEQMLQEI